MNRTPVTDWQQLSALYEQADALDPAPLADWLAALRVQAHPLLPQLMQMLEARAQVRENGFLGTLPHLPQPPEPRAIGWQANARIGAYRLLKRIGTGGMAEVWLAQRDDGAFERQVAIKLLFRHAGSSERDAFAQRFARERDILASLDHGNIAALHDAGVTPDGQPWLALEYVEGDSLTAWCDARRLTLQERVRLFRQVLLAVQHAHANLVIHRDLKPGNILVTAQGEVRLLDFGIAKLIEPEGGALVDTELTRLAGRPMTPQYASPEQLTGQPLTTASDVYSLGVVLYELLCGERPYELKVQSPAQLEQAIVEADPRPPSRRVILEAAAAERGTHGVELRRQLANDLDAIVLRALAKRPMHRYGSVEALRADLDRWLAGEPVAARTPSTLYRARKFVRRHVLAVGLGAGAVVALMVVTAAAVVMGLQAREDSARAVAARDFMLNIFKRADQEKSHGADITARDLLETGRKDVLTRLAGQPRLQAELLRGIAKIQDDMGEYAAADATFEELERTWATLRNPREQALARIDRALNALGMNRPDLARRLRDEARSRSDRSLDDAEVDAGFARLTGLLDLDAGRAAQALGPLSAAYQAARRSLGDNSFRTFWLGQALLRADRDTGKIDDALALQENLRVAARQVKGLGADEFASIDLEQVNLLYSAGRFKRALSVSEEALPRCVEALGARAQMCRYLSVRNAQLLVKLGEFGLADQTAPQVQAIAEDPSIPFLQIEALIFELRLRTAERDQRTATAASDAFQQVRLFAQAPDKVPALRAGAMLGLAESLLRTGDSASSKAWIDKALALLNERLDGMPLSRTGANAQMLMGVALLEDGSLADAVARLDSALRYFSDTLGPDHPTTQTSALNVALAAQKSGAIVGPLKAVDKAQPILRDALGVEAPACRQVSDLRARLTAHPPAPVPSISDEPQPSAVRYDARAIAHEFFSI